jgi:very-short-patch-repair endonuclease
MRREPTPFEQKLWYALRAKRFAEAKFRRQVVIDRYIVDFACRIPRMIVIEVDGDTHGDQRQYDARRTAYLRGRGYRVLRFTNQDVGKNMEGVLMAVAEALKPSPLQGRAGSGVATEGEGIIAKARLPLSPAASGSSVSPLKGREV